MSARTCFTCKEEMYEGYLAEEFSKTFCSAECLDKEFYVGLAETISNTPEDEEDDLVIFWTEWEDEDEEPECPRCFDQLNADAELNAVCRIDGETIICSDCGTEQAMKDLFDTLK